MAAYRVALHGVCGRRRVESHGTTKLRLRRQTGQQLCLTRPGKVVIFTVSAAMGRLHTIIEALYLCIGKWANAT